MPLSEEGLLQLPLSPVQRHYVLGTLEPLLRDLVAALVAEKPVQPVPFIKGWLHTRILQAVSTEIVSLGGDPRPRQETPPAQQQPPPPPAPAPAVAAEEILAPEAAVEPTPLDGRWARKDRPSRLVATILGGQIHWEDGGDGPPLCTPAEVWDGAKTGGGARARASTLLSTTGGGGAARARASTLLSRRGTGVSLDFADHSGHGLTAMLDGEYHSAYLVEGLLVWGDGEAWVPVEEETEPQAAWAQSGEPAWRDIVGAWNFPGDNPVCRDILEVDGTYFFWNEFFPMEAEANGQWMWAKLNNGMHVRCRPGPSGRTLMWQRRAPGNQEWSQTLFLPRYGALDDGAPLLTKDAATIWSAEAPPSRSVLGMAHAGAALVAAGPPTEEAVPKLPLRPHGYLIDYDAVRPLEPWVPPVPAESAEDSPEGATASGDRFTDLGPIFEALEGGDTVLLRGTWLRDLAAEGGVLPKRQELEPRAEWEPEDLRPLLVERKVQLVAVSHCWLTPEHPDPEGQQLRLVGRALGARLAERTLRVEDLAVFWDWCSLHQKPRRPDQAAAHKRALEAASLWYAHAETLVLTLSNPPPGGRPYHLRGWPFFEQAVGALLKDACQLLDLGLWPEAEDDEGLEAWFYCATKATGQRLPPLAPDAFDEQLEGRTFAEPADRAFLSRAYRETFHEVLGNATVLDLSGLGWTPPAVAQLSEVLPHCAKLKRLTLNGNHVGAEGAAALAEHLPSCPALRHLELYNTQLGDTGVEFLASALPSCPALKGLSLQKAGFGAAGAASLFDSLPACPLLDTLNLAGNEIGSLPLGELANNIACCPFLRQLIVTSTGLTKEDADVILATWEQERPDRTLNVRV